jgi:hypothetical protein
MVHESPVCGGVPDTWLLPEHATIARNNARESATLKRDGLGRAARSKGLPSTYPLLYRDVASPRQTDRALAGSCQPRA